MVPVLCPNQVQYYDNWRLAVPTQCFLCRRGILMDKFKMVWCLQWPFYLCGLHEAHSRPSASCRSLVACIAFCDCECTFYAWHFVWYSRYNKHVSKTKLALRSRLLKYIKCNMENFALVVFIFDLMTSPSPAVSPPVPVPLTNELYFWRPWRPVLCTQCPGSWSFLTQGTLDSNVLSLMHGCIEEQSDPNCI